MTKLNFAHQTIWTGDNLEIMRGMNSGCIDLIYLDPPFNSHRDYSGSPKSKSEGATFKDTWTAEDIDPAWEQIIESKHETLSYVIKAATAPSDKSYLIYMAVRLLEMRRILADTGSIYLHCDPTMSHYLKLVMDAIFGRKQFRNEIVWSYRRWAGKTRKYQSMHDILLFYCNGSMKEGTWNWPTEPKAPGSPKVKLWNAIDPKTGKMRTYRDDSIPSPETNMRDVWEIGRLQSTAKERTGYPTQKPLKLLQRIIKASSNPGDMVLDPFCGCATACLAAEAEKRQWVGIDSSPRAVEIAHRRMRETVGDLAYHLPTRPPRIPRRTDIGIM